MKIYTSLELHDPDVEVSLQQKHLDAINYLLESNIRHERTTLAVHHQYLENAREVILRALKVDAPNHPLTGLMGRVAVPDEEC